MYTAQRKTPVILLCSIKGGVYVRNIGLINEKRLRFVSTVFNVKNQEWLHGSQQRCVELSPVSWTMGMRAEHCYSEQSLTSPSPADEAFLELHIVVSTAAITGKKEALGKLFVYRNCPAKDYFV